MKRILLASLLFILILVVMMAIPAYAVPGNLVSNGGFETPIITDTNLWHHYTTSELGSNWTVEWNPSDAHPEETPVLEIQSGVCGAPYEGNQFAELDSTHSTSIYQDFATIPGNFYALRFAFSPRSGTGVGDNHLQIQLGSKVDDISADGTGNSGTSWTTYVYSVQATETTTRVQFTDLGNSDSYGTFIDDVSVTEYTSDPLLPELPAGILLGIGLACVGGIIILKRHAGGAAVK
jgi:hypothetical protein